MPEPIPPRELLRWYLDAGVDETIADAPVNRFQSSGGTGTKGLAEAQPRQPASSSPPPPASSSPAPPASSSPPPPASSSPAPLAPSSPAPPAPAPKKALFADEAAEPQGGAEGLVASAVHLAQAATTVDELRRALEGFDGCVLRKTATNLVFTDGNPQAPILFVGEGPGAEEDRQGLPFVGPSGKLLDKMLASIGLDRTGVLISNTVFWRPPGNRTPTPQETAVCMPFIERLIELVDPKVLVALGGPAAKALLAQTAGVGRLRGKWFTYSTPGLARPIDATAMFHPAYLLRSPGQKRDTWRDLIEIKRKLAAD